MQLFLQKLPLVIGMLIMTMLQCLPVSADDLDFTVTVEDVVATIDCYDADDSNTTVNFAELTYGVTNADTKTISCDITQGDAAATYNVDVTSAGNVITMTHTNTVNTLDATMLEDVSCTGGGDIVVGSDWQAGGTYDPAAVGTETCSWDITTDTIDGSYLAGSYTSNPYTFTITENP